MKCQVFVPRSDGSVDDCPNDAEYAHRMTEWADGGRRVYTCAEHRLPREAYQAAYYVGNGSTRAKVVPIEAAHVRRARAKAQ